MTDTTDIKALREAMLTKGKSSLTAKEVVTIISELDRLGDSVKHLRIEASASDAAFLEMKKQYSTQFDRCRELSGQLEAERQRADAVCRDIRIQAIDLKSAQTVNKVLQAELAALKSDQVPIGYGWFHKDTGKFSSHVSRTNAHNEYPFVASLAAEGYRPDPVYDRPQKPVVLPAMQQLKEAVDFYLQVQKENPPIEQGMHKDAD